MGAAPRNPEALSCPACNPTFTVFYGQILVWFGINFIPQGTIELVLRDDFEQVR